jgi:hypothetical protein
VAPRRLPLVERVERRTDAIAHAMLSNFVGDIPIYARLPNEQLRGEILAIVRENLRIFFRCVRERRGPTDAELAEPRASAARRAEERIPLEAVLTAYHLGGRIGWQAMAAEARPDEHDELVAIADRVLTYIQALSSAVASAYLEEQQHIYGEERDARRTLADALLTGDVGGSPVDADTVNVLARRAGVRLANGYLVLALRLGPSPDELDSGVVGAVASRRKVRRVQAELDARAGEPVLTLLGADGGAVLFPVDPSDAEKALAAAGDLVAGLAVAAEAEVTAGAAWRAGVEGAAAAAAEAREVVNLATHLQRPPGAYRLDDVLLEHTLTHPPEAASRLVRLLEPLESKPDLVETLEQWFAADFDRRQAAAALNVHPNTLDYRLRRIAELTELETTTAQGIQLLGAALTARRFRAPGR